MKKLLFLLLLSSTVFAQEVKPDSTDIVVFTSYQDSLNKSLTANQAFVKDFQEKFGKYYDNGFQYGRFETISIDDLEMGLFEQRAAQKKLLTEAKVDNFLKNHLKREAELQYWHLLYAHPIVRGNKDQKLRRVISVPEIITKDFDKSVFTKTDNLKSQAFRNLVPYWVTYENSKAHNFEKYTNMLLAVNDKVEFSLQNFKGLIADYSLAQILTSNQKYLSTSLAQNVISQIENETLRNRFTGKFLDEVMAENEKLEIARKEAEAKASEKDRLEFIDLAGKKFDLTKYKGKVIYLDFWASWCGPCKVQFPFSKTLHKSIPQKLKKDIVFLYISIDDTEEKWKDAIKSNGLEEFENGFTPGAWGSPVLAKLGIRSIPRYMLIDKSGKIVDANAKRPNSPDILTELLKLAE